MTEIYRSSAGSEVTVDGENVTISFHWHDEGAHPDVRLETDLRDPDNPMLYWECACCDPGEARLVRVTPGAGVALTRPTSGR